MVHESAELIDAAADFPIFEAMFLHNRILVWVEMLIPDGEGWQAIKVKASTAVKELPRARLGDLGLGHAPFRLTRHVHFAGPHQQLARVSGRRR